MDWGDDWGDDEGLDWIQIANAVRTIEVGINFPCNC